MSKTVRRKETWYERQYVCREEEQDTAHWPNRLESELRRWGVSTIEQLLQKKKAWFHGDGTRFGLPRAYRHKIEVQYRMLLKRDLRHILEDKGETLTRFRWARGRGWHYW